jgi:LysR family glycine cleavage system transcriptional activator
MQVHQRAAVPALQRVLQCGHRGLKFENAALAYQAAADQLGVIVALLPFVRDDLATGRLVEPFGVRVGTPGAYWLASRATGPDQPGRVRAFEEWILAEAGQDAG